MGKNLNFGRAHQTDKLRRPPPPPVEERGREWLAQVNELIAIDANFAKMRRAGVNEARCACPRCGHKGTVHLVYAGPRAARARCTREGCDFAMMA